MRLPTQIFPLLVAVFAQRAFAAGLPPWELGMSKAEVTSKAEFGPYKEFKNGDVETYNGLFEGKKENVQFFFKEERLRRIGVYLYEGTDPQLATAAWQEAYEDLRRRYGEISIPGLKVTAEGQAQSEGLKASTIDPAVLARAAGANTDAVGKTHMAPVTQPDDTFVFSRFWRDEVDGKPYYFVAVFLEPPRR